MPWTELYFSASRAWCCTHPTRRFSPGPEPETETATCPHLMPVMLNPASLKCLSVSKHAITSYKGLTASPMEAWPHYTVFWILKSQRRGCIPFQRSSNTVPPLSRPGVKLLQSNTKQHAKWKKQHVYLTKHDNRSSWFLIGNWIGSLLRYCPCPLLISTSWHQAKLIISRCETTLKKNN